MSSSFLVVRFFFNIAYFLRKFHFFEGFFEVFLKIKSDLKLREGKVPIPEAL